MRQNAAKCILLDTQPRKTTSTARLKQPWSVSRRLFFATFPRWPTCSWAQFFCAKRGVQCLRPQFRFLTFRSFKIPSFLDFFLCFFATVDFHGISMEQGQDSPGTFFWDWLFQSRELTFFSTVLEYQTSTTYDQPTKLQCLFCNGGLRKTLYFLVSPASLCGQVSVICRNEISKKFGRKSAPVFERR